MMRVSLSCPDPSAPGLSPQRTVLDPSWQAPRPVRQQDRDRLSFNVLELDRNNVGSHWS